ncbi:MAG: crotonase/enoyl-CoA hydratase family protein [Myxococcota bacterium]
MDTLVSYRLEGSIATITMDDQKANALSPLMLAELDAALDRAAEHKAVVVLTGRPGTFSAGFDLGVLRAGGPPAVAMFKAGFELSLRLLSFPTPVVVACTGHAIAMGLFLLQSGDYRVGALGPYKIVANEVALGITLPYAAVEVMRQRLTPAAFTRAALLSEPFTPEAAVAAGFLDQAVAPSEVESTAQGLALALTKLNMNAHAASKLRVRAPTLAAIRAGIDADFGAAATG